MKGAGTLGEGAGSKHRRSDSDEERSESEADRREASDPRTGSGANRERPHRLESARGFLHVRSGYAARTPYFSKHFQ